MTQATPPCAQAVFESVGLTLGHDRDRAMLSELKGQTQTRDAAADDNKVKLAHRFAGLGFVQKSQDAAQRDSHPLRPIVEFIAKLIQGFENQETS